MLRQSYKFKLNRAGFFACLFSTASFIRASAIQAGLPPPTPALARIKKKGVKNLKKISLLGSTGSIGTQTLDVVRKHNFSVTSLAVNSNTKLLEQQAREFKPEKVCVFDTSKYSDIKARLADTDIKIVSGMDGLC